MFLLAFDGTLLGRESVSDSYLHFGLHKMLIRPIPNFRDSWSEKGCGRLAGAPFIALVKKTAPL